jgi:Condensation domain
MNSEPIPRRPAGMTELPLSALQQRIYHLCTSYEGTSSPVVYLAHRLRGPVDIDALAAALRDVSERQESMRMRIVVRSPGAGPVVVVDPPGGLEVRRLDLSGLPEAEREARLRDLLDEWALTLFELPGGSLVHARIVRMGEDDHVLSVVLHHIIADGQSLTVLADEIAAHYRARVTGTPPDVPPLTVGYGDFAVWQSRGDGTGGADGLEYWTRRLAGLPVPDVTTDHPRPAQKGTRGAELRYRLDAETTTGLERFARAQRCTLFHVMLAAFWALLSRHGAGEDVCVGSPVGGRTRVEFEPLVGNFGNTLPLRGDLSGDPTFAELVGRARTATFGALAHQDVPFAHVVAALDLPRDPSRMQVFGAILVLHYTEADDPLPGLPAEAIPAVGAPQITHDIVLDAFRDTDGLNLMLRYDAALFEGDTVRAWAAELEAMLRAAIA